jgi:ABC-type nitrate/sulfonate/bicarbonate transport system substrate-binding protein
MRRRVHVAALAVALVLALAGCGEISDTITPQAGTANQLTVALGGAPTVSEAGMYAAQAHGQLAATDLDVHFQQGGDASPLAELIDGGVQVAITTPPALLQFRNSYHAVVAVAAVIQTPQPTQVTCKTAKPKKGSKKPATTKCTAAAGTTPPAPYTGAPTYPGIVIAVTKSEIVNRAPLIRRFVQAVARGYRLLQTDPSAGTAALVAANPKLNPANTTTAVQLSLSSYFPAGEHPWGWLYTSQWNALGQWMLNQHLLSVANTLVDEDDNELLAGQGL